MADPQKREHQNLPPVDFRVGCTCTACELGIVLWYTEDDHPARTAWQLYWYRVFDRENDEGGKFWVNRPCLWQWGRCLHTEPTPKPTAYKIC